jgi:hypothetical protein
MGFVAASASASRKSDLMYTDLSAEWRQLGIKDAVCVAFKTKRRMRTTPCEWAMALIS